MKKLTLLLLLMVSTSVLAEWIKVNRDEQDDRTTYFNDKSIQKKGKKVKIWYVMDFPREYDDPVNRGKWISILNHDEYDCEDRTHKILDYYFQTEHMGKGFSVIKKINIKEEPISLKPDDYVEPLFNITCGKK